jgi:methylenetetrahydrofolate--tRNA-(uracil-5-)-methyltransferase
VRLLEMRPTATTPAHTTGWFAELVCSNSLKSKAPDSPAGLLKAEMRALGSLVLACAEETEVPGGQALCVDREAFGALVTARLEAHPLVTVERREWTPLELDVNPLPGSLRLPTLPLGGGGRPDAGPVILATGPLSTDPVSTWLADVTGRKHLHFYDAVSPTVEAASIDRSVAFEASRWGKGGDDYLNCPFDKDRYFEFVRELVAAERVPIQAFEAGGVRTADGTGDPTAFLEKVKYFAGCTPIEAIADGGERSLAFGNFKPVGLTDPRTGRRPYAALQLRPENRDKTLYSLVACQNRLRFGEQKRVFRMVPGLERAEFVRYGVIHRNTYLDAPRVLTPELELRGTPGVFVSGQLTGVEGYVESAAMGIWSGLVAVARLRGETAPTPPPSTAYAGLLAHLQDATPREFAPMNINWGLLPDVDGDPRDKGARRAAKLARAQEASAAWSDALSRSGLALTATSTR